MTKGINLKYIDNTGFLHEFMQEEIAKDPNAEQLYMEARAELQIALMVKELRISKKLSQADLAKKWVNLNQLLDELKMDQSSRLFPCCSNRYEIRNFVCIIN